MDIERPDLARKGKKKRTIMIALGVLAIISASAFTFTIEAPLPTVSEKEIWTGKAERGTMVRNVRGSGHLVPSSMRWIASSASGRVEEVFIHAGTPVDADTLIIRMSNPELIQEHQQAQFDLEQAEAELCSAQVELQSDLLAQRCNVVTLRENSEMADLDARIQEELFADELTPGLNRERALLHAKHSKTRLEMEEQRLQFMESSTTHQLASITTRVKRARAYAELLSNQVAALEIRAGFCGVLQQMDLEPGMNVSQGQLIAQVADMETLKAELSIQQALAWELKPGLNVEVDTITSGKVMGRLERINPNVERGMVLAEVTILGPLPEGCRAQQSVQGLIEIERIDDTVFIPRPSAVTANSKAWLFKMAGSRAVKVPVSLGRSSASTIEILNGLAPGDTVILSDTSRWKDKNALMID